MEYKINIKNNLIINYSNRFIIFLFILGVIFLINFIFFFNLLFIVFIKF